MWFLLEFHFSDFGVKQDLAHKLSLFVDLPSTNNLR
jgi:hypothetical protein